MPQRNLRRGLDASRASQRCSLTGRSCSHDWPCLG
jgi:hypothetical protein